MKSIAEINERIRDGSVVVLTAEELIARMDELGGDDAPEEAYEAVAREVDVVTTATFGAMCSSGAFLNFGHAEPPIRMAKLWLNDVEAYGGLAAVDTYLGATQPSDTHGIEYGGAHVIEDLVAGKRVHLRATSPGTDCYPRKSIDTWVGLEDLNQAYLYNPRNLYQNYGAATNSSGHTIRTYMGTLLPEYGNITYSTSGELSPLLKDPELRTIGLGTKIFLGGGMGLVVGEGTQAVRRHDLIDGDDHYSGVTLAVQGDLKQMNARYLRGASFAGYGVSLYVGIGVPIPVLDAALLRQLAVPNAQLWTRLTDYSQPTRSRAALADFNYAELRSGSVEFNGRRVNTAPLSSLAMAREIAALLQDWIATGHFLLQEAVMPFSIDKPLKALDIKEA